MPARIRPPSVAEARFNRKISALSGDLEPVLAASVVGEEAAWRRGGVLRSLVLRSIAQRLRTRREDILRVASAETALLPDELSPEFDRMVRTLELFASIAEEGRWCRATIDLKSKPRVQPIGPNHDLRSMLLPIGVVAVFGASNFPLAYGVCGGDTASALAAGCSVVVKEHPAHPLTGRLIHAIAREGIDEAGGNVHLLGYVRDENPQDHAIAERLVLAGFVSGVGFTGSSLAGRALDELARSRPDPIPVFAEMGSVNPVRVSPRSLRLRAERIAHELADSVLQRHGQQCTKPGVIFVQPGRGLERFLRVLTERFKAAPCRAMLSPWIRDAYMRRLSEVKRVSGVRVLAKADGESGERTGVPHLLYVKRLSAMPWTLMEEIFGPATLVCELDAWDDHNLSRPSALTWSIYQEPGERHAFGEDFESDILTSRAGRLVFNGPPTGVRVAHASNHTGPWPACNRPDTTAVGPRAIERWCRHVCWQNCPDALLPAELQDANPLGIERMVDGVRTRGVVKR